jgi:hypothetical protein
MTLGSYFGRNFNTFFRLSFLLFLIAGPLPPGGGFEVRACTTTIFGGIFMGIVGGKRNHCWISVVHSFTLTSGIFFIEFYDTLEPLL